MVNIVIVSAALGFGIWLLVARGRMSWPPGDLLANAFTLAGCLALIGPILLLRRESGEGSVGELMWLTGGALVWVYDLLGLIRGEARLATFATPLAPTTLGLTILAVLLASWRMRGPGKSWSWTNITGWIIGVFWIGIALAALAPGNPVRLALR